MKKECECLGCCTYDMNKGHCVLQQSLDSPYFDVTSVMMNAHVILRPQTP